VREQAAEACHPSETLVPGLAVLEPGEYRTAITEQPRRQRVGAKLPTVRYPSAATQHGADQHHASQPEAKPHQRIGTVKPGSDHAGEPRDQANGPELGGEQRQRVRRPAGRDPAPDPKPRRAPRPRPVRGAHGPVSQRHERKRAAADDLLEAIRTASSFRSSRPALGVSTPEILALPPDGQIGLEPPFQTGLARERPLRHRAIRHGNWPRKQGIRHG
jgi:hypothetical protein